MSLWRPIRIPQGSCQATTTRAAGMQGLGVAQEGGEKDSDFTPAGPNCNAMV